MMNLDTLFFIKKIEKLQELESLVDFKDKHIFTDEFIEITKDFIEKWEHIENK